MNQMNHLMVALRQLLPWTPVLLFVGFAYGVWPSLRAPAWCRLQRKLLANPLQVDEINVDPHPLRERTKLLQQVGDALAEGDLGSFLLRRQDVPGQDTAAHLANLLVTFSLFLTIVGLVVTLFELSAALQTGSGTAPSAAGQQSTRSPYLRTAEPEPPAPSSDEAFNELMKRIREPLGHLPWLFVPTSVGLLLAVVCAAWQRKIETEVERTWHELDQYKILGKIRPL